LLGNTLLKLTFNTRTISALLLLLTPYLTYSAGYVPLPDVVPAYDDTKPQPVIKKTPQAAKKTTNNALPYIQNFSTEIEMFAGETRVISEPNAGRLAVGNGSALSAAVLDDKEILLIANETGVSSLHIWTKDGRNRRIKVTVMPGETSRVSKEVASFLKTIPKAKATLVGDKVVVEGEGMADNDLTKVEELSKRYPQIINFTNRQGWEKMIAMDVKVVEFPTKFLREVGIKWGATGGGAVGAVWGPVRYNNDGPFQINQISGTQNAAPITGGGGSALAIPSGLNILSVLNVGFNAQLNMLEQNGTAVILARPTLSTRSGTKAKFLAGGEFPYSVSNINGTTIEFKPYGIKLDIEPRVDQSGVIRAKIFSEVSDIDSSVSTLSGPALRTRRTESEFNVQDGQTIVLSGLLSRDKNVTVDKLPFLGDIPILGALFRSKRYQNNETELVVFVTPTSSEKHTHNQQEEMDKATQRLQADSIALGNQSQKQIKKQASQPTSTNGSDANPATGILANPNPY
jgi:pilus assembly protein CpaC